MMGRCRADNDSPVGTLDGTSDGISLGTSEGGSEGEADDSTASMEGPVGLSVLVGGATRLSLGLATMTGMIDIGPDVGASSYP